MQRSLSLLIEAKVRLYVSMNKDVALIFEEIDACCVEKTPVFIGHARHGFTRVGRQCLVTTKGLPEFKLELAGPRFAHQLVVVAADRNKIR